MEILPLREIFQVVKRWKTGFLKARTIRSEIIIKSNCNQAEYRLIFKRSNLQDSGNFYLISLNQNFQLHDLVLYSLLANIKRGNYDILSALSIFETGSFEESEKIPVQFMN
ncbi:hypothetical protein [Niallia oryzisoli]|uniref:hypothetical protein n=1 Tax=Niallia oryzisoli TaxID=1737571 RepID=UPI003734CCBE